MVNYSFPLTIEDYVHRVGGRAGPARAARHTFFHGDGHEKALGRRFTKCASSRWRTRAGRAAEFGSTVKKKEDKDAALGARGPRRQRATKIVPTKKSAVAVIRVPGPKKPDSDRYEDQVRTAPRRRTAQSWPKVRARSLLA